MISEALIIDSSGISSVYVMSVLCHVSLAFYFTCTDFGYSSSGSTIGVNNMMSVSLVFYFMYLDWSGECEKSVKGK